MVLRVQTPRNKFPKNFYMLLHAKYKKPGLLRRFSMETPPEILKPLRNFFWLRPCSPRLMNAKTCAIGLLIFLLSGCRSFDYPFAGFRSLQHPSLLTSFIPSHRSPAIIICSNQSTPISETRSVFHDFLSTVCFYENCSPGATHSVSLICDRCNAFAKYSPA